MSNYERKNNTATLFNNDYKEKDTHPDLKGEALVGDAKYRMSAWRKIDKNGNDYYSIQLQTEEEAEKYKKERSNVQEQANKSTESTDTSLPF